MLKKTTRTNLKLTPRDVAAIIESHIVLTTGRKPERVYGTISARVSEERPGTYYEYDGHTAEMPEDAE